MANKQTARLAFQIVLSHFGPSVACVASHLLTRGRLSSQTLQRINNSSTPSLKPKVLRTSLLVLIQHNIVWWYIDDDGNDVYEIDWEEVLSRLRLGRYVNIAKKALGAEAASVIALILDHGKLKQGQVLDLMLPSANPKRQAHVKRAFHALVTQKYLRPCTVESHLSPRDRLFSFEVEARKERRGKGPVLTPKELQEIKAQASAKLIKEKEDTWDLALKNKEVTGKRKAGILQDEQVVNEDVYFNVNYSKFNTFVRNDIIVEAALHRYNLQTARVLQAALASTQDKQENLVDFRSDPISSSSIASHLTHSSDLSSGVLFHKSKSKDHQEATVKDYLPLLCSEDNPTAQGQASAFMARAIFGGGNTGKVTVEFETIGKRLKFRVFEGNVRERFGDEAVKVVRILMDKGKMDEKHLAKVALMAPNILRPLLTRLSAASLVSLQEVPKSADRNPSRTFYLWYVDLSKAYSNLLASLYQTLANIVARDREEQERIRPILDKRDRSDVNGDEALLGRGEVAALREWEGRQLRLGVLLMRVEENVFVLRDMLGDPE